MADGQPADFTQQSQTTQTGQGVPPANAQGQVTAQKAVNDLMGQQVEFVTNLNDALSKSPDHIKASVSAMRDWQTNLKGIVKYTEDYEDAFKRLLAINRQYGETGIFKAKNYAELIDNLELLRDESEKLMKSGFYDKNQQKAIQTNIDQFSNSIKLVGTNMQSTGRKMTDALDPELMTQLGEKAKRTSKNIENLGKA